MSNELYYRDGDVWVKGKSALLFKEGQWVEAKELWQFSDGTWVTRWNSDTLTYTFTPGFVQVGDMAVGGYSGDSGPSTTGGLTPTDLEGYGTIIMLGFANWPGIFDFGGIMFAGARPNSVLLTYRGQEYTLVPDSYGPFALGIQDQSLKDAFRAQVKADADAGEKDIAIGLKVLS